MNIAFFISSHGYGHAAREAAIISALRSRDPSILISIYTETPASFFIQSGINDIQFHAVKTDIGLVQNSPFQSDLEETIRQLKTWNRSFDSLSLEMAGNLKKTHTDLVISDISPLGIASAQKAGIPSLLIENFTWDWIYEPYLPDYPGFKTIIETYRAVYNAADFHVQLDPVCKLSNKSSLTIPLVSRIPLKSRDETRHKLGITPAQQLGIISMGGIPYNYTNLSDYYRTSFNVKLAFLGNFESVTTVKDVIQIPHVSDFYHPDLVSAADFVIGKAGYSLIAEVITQGKPFGYINRSDFRESPCLDQFLRQVPNAIEVKPEFDSLTEVVDRLSNFSTLNYPHQNGAEIAADFIIQQASLGQ